jgi:flagellin
MALVINTNTSSLKTQNNLTKSTSALATATERLSSGLKINSAKDNAAGYAISTRFTTQIGGLSQASSNASDAISLAQTAGSALDEVTSNLQAIRDLAVQSANGTYTDSDRAAIDTEVQQRLSEVTRIANQTDFNGTNVLNGSTKQLNFQVGANVGQVISVDLGQGVKASDLGAVAEVKTGDLSSLFTGSPAVAAVAAVAATNAVAATPATATGSVDASGGSDFTTTAGSLTVDGNTIALTADDADGDALATDIQTKLNATAGNNYTVTADATTGALTIAKPAGAGAAPVISGTSAASLFGTVTSTAGADAVAATAGTPAVAAVAATTAPDLSGESLTINGTSVSLKGVTSLQDLTDTVNAAGITGVSAAVSSDGKGVNFYSATALTITDANTATGGAKNVITSAAKDANTNTSYTSGTAAAASGSLATGSVGTVDGANDLISRVDVALTSVSNLASTLGAVQNRFSSTISTLSSESQNLTSSQSTIQDADFAAETANLSKAQVLQQAGISVLSQANSQPQQVLKLLQ